MSIRQEKVGSQIRRLVSDVLARQVHDPRIEGLVTITKVDVTPDLREARVYVSLLTLKEKGSPKTVMHGLESAAKRIQDLVAEGLPLRMAPRLSFHLDESLKKEAEMFKKIDEVANERAKNPVITNEESQARHDRGVNEDQGQMNKPNIKTDVLKRVMARLCKAAPARKTEAADPLARLVRAFLEYDCDEDRAAHGEQKFKDNMVDMNELRVTPAIELASLLGVRYPFAESRCSALHRTLQSIFDREHHMRMERMKEMKKSEIRPYLQSLAGITPYVEAAVALECFDIPAVPVDTKLMLWLVSKDALPEGLDLRAAQQILERNIKPANMMELFHGSRKEIDGWSPKSWPPVAKAYSPVLAPPPLNARGEEILIVQDPVPTSPRPPEDKNAKKDKKGKQAKAQERKAAAALEAKRAGAVKTTPLAGPAKVMVAPVKTVAAPVKTVAAPAKAVAKPAAAKKK